MSQVQNVNQGMVRIDYSRADKYLYPEPPKLTFWQKLGRGLGKFVSFAGPIGAAVSAVTLGPLGIPVAAGLFGLTQASRDQLYRSQMKDQVALANQPQPGSLPVILPGLFEMPHQAGAMATDFMAPAPLVPSISDVVIDRNSAQQEAVTHF